MVECYLARRECIEPVYAVAQVFVSVRSIEKKERRKDLLAIVSGWYREGFCIEASIEKKERRKDLLAIVSGWYRAGFCNLLASVSGWHRAGFCNSLASASGLY